MDIKGYINTLGLEVHPEGGFYKRIYASDIQQEFSGFSGKRHLTTAIQYLLCAEQYSAWHRIKSDELWVFSSGNTAVRIHEINEGIISTVELAEAAPQYTVKANTWFAAELLDKTQEAFVLCHCIVSPGFDFIDFDMADLNVLDSLQPSDKIRAKALIRRE